MCPAINADPKRVTLVAYGRTEEQALKRHIKLMQSLSKAHELYISMENMGYNIKVREVK